MATQPMWGAIDPSIISDQTALDRQQQIAQYLRQQALAPMGGTEFAGNVAIRRSPLEGLAKLLSGYQAGQMDKENDAARLTLAQKSADAMNKAFSGMLGGGAPEPAAPADPENMPAGAPAQSFPVGNTAPAQGAPGMPQGTQGMTQEQFIKNAARAAFMMGNTDLANKLVGNLLEMTQEQKNMRAMGQDPLEMGRLATAAARKSGIIELQPGTTAVDLATGQERFQPTLAPGVQYQGGVASPVPGFAQANAGIKGAEASATEGAKMMTVNLPDGTTQQMTQAQYQSLMAPQGAPANVAQMAARNGDTNYAYNVGGRQGVVTGGPSAPAGLGRSADPVKQAAEKSYQEGVAKDQVEQRKAIMASGMAASQKIAKYQQLDKLLGDFEGGKLSQGAMDFASLGNSLGLKIDSTLPNKEAAAVISNQLALEARSTAEGGGMPGAMSEGDRKFLIAMTPSLGQTAEGRKTIISSAIALEQRKAQVAEFARKYENKYGKLDNGFYSQLQSWSDQNPLFGGK